MPPAPQDLAQARWILARGWLSQPQLEQALASRSAACPDLAAELVRLGWLDPARARAAREATAPPLHHKTDPLLEPPGPSQDGFASAEPIRVPSASSAGSFSRSVSMVGVGGVFRDFELLAEAGRGGMGVVYKARRVSDGRLVALKLMTVGLQDPSALTRFEREAAALLALRHPHIVAIVDAGIEGQRAFLAMEWLEGQDYAQLLSAQPALPPLAEVVAVIRPIAAALSACHAAGIIHRDVKPHNIFIEAETGRPVLVDFGLIKRTAEESRGLTRTQERLGTPLFMAPEQFSPGDVYGDIGPPCDVWALTATFVFALLGRPPFPGQTPMEIFRQLRREAPPTPSALRDELPPWVDELVVEGLRRSAVERISLEAFREALTTRRSGRPLLKLGAALALALLAAVVGALALSEPPPPPSLAFDEPGEIAPRAQPRLTLRGEVRGEGLAELSLRVGRARAEVAADGRFELLVKGLEEGSQELRIELLRGEQVVAVESRRVVVDQTPPVILPKSSRLSAPSLEGEVYDLGSDDLLYGQVEDASPVTVETRLGAVEVDAQGRFAAPVLRRYEPQSVRLIARDAAGNVAERSVQVLTGPPGREQLIEALIEDRIGEPAERLSWELLCDVERWRRAGEPAQQAAAELVAGRLGKAFELRGLERFEQRGEAMAVAVFEDTALRLRMHLIPGGVREVTLYDPPENEFALLYLGGVMKAQKVIPAFMSTLAFPPLASYYEELEARFGINLRGIREAPEPLMRFQLALGFVGGFIAAGQAEQLPEFWTELEARVRRQTRERSVEVAVGPFLLARDELSREVFGLEACLNPHPMRKSHPALVNAEVGRAWLAARPFLRLPTRLEWRHACCGGGPPGWFWGDDLSSAMSYGEFSVVVDELRPKLFFNTVDASFEPNGYGLRQMLGNAEELCLGNGFDIEARARQEALRAGYPPPELEPDDELLFVGGQMAFPVNFCKSYTVRFPGPYRQDLVGLRAAASVPTLAEFNRRPRGSGR